MSQRRVKVTAYVVMLLFDKHTDAYLRDAYAEVSFSFAVPNVPDAVDIATLVPEEAIYKRLDAFITSPQLYQRLKLQFPDLPAFAIRNARLMTDTMFFEYEE